MLSKPLPEYCYSKQRMKSVDGVVLHYFSAKNVDHENMFDMSACRDLFIDLNLPKDARRKYMKTSAWPDDRMYASAHYLIGRAGEVWSLVSQHSRAYHAGVSYMDGRMWCNQFTLGIELVGHQHSGFTDIQYESLANLLVMLEEKHGFSRDSVQGHDTVRNEALKRGMKAKAKYDVSGRKDGQGSNFDWESLHFIWNEKAPLMKLGVKARE